VFAQYLPGLQGVHDDDAAVSENVPAGQKVHVVDIAPPAEKEPGGHSPFGALRDVVEQYMPGVQEVQNTELAPPDEYVPAEHTPLGALRAAVEQYMPGVQGVHDVEPVDAAKEPEKQLVHVEAPAVPENLPAPQAVHELALQALPAAQ
jgi:hypothetical protein